MHQGLGTMLRALVDQLDVAVQGRYRDAGLDYRPRFTPIVRHLEARGPSSLRAIAKTAGVSHSAISQTVAQMERVGLVTKQTGSDAREQVVALSDTATAMLPTLHDCWRQTDAAARRLSNDAGCDLEAAIGNALRCLEERPFGERLLDEMPDRRATPLKEPPVLEPGPRITAKEVP